METDTKQLFFTVDDEPIAQTSFAIFTNPANEHKFVTSFYDNGCKKFQWKIRKINEPFDIQDQFNTFDTELLKLTVTPMVYYIISRTKQKTKLINKIKSNTNNYTFLTPPLPISTPLTLSSSSMNLDQYECDFQTLTISSIGIPLVSGSMKNTKIVITKTKKPKKMNKPNFMWHNIIKKTCATKKVKSMLTDTLTLWAAERISNGKISLGTNQPRGPHDQANPAT